jgi:hypothetical protein
VDNPNFFLTFFWSFTSMMLKGHKHMATVTTAERPNGAFTSFGLSAFPCASPGLDLQLIGVNGIDNRSAGQRFADYSRHLS